uniref:Uncharacterized protein n=1 Tax=Solanum tuberosum TaxID=4113 RepID=M1D9Q4_SOLTU
MGNIALTDIDHVSYMKSGVMPPHRKEVSYLPKAGHRTGTNRNRIVDRYRDEPDRNYRDGGSVPSRPTIYRDRTGTDRNGPERNGMG